MKHLKQILSNLDRNGLFYLSAFLVAFIPLFPKIPLFEVLPGYIVRARLEDALIFLTALVWLKDAYKKRFPVNTTYLWFVLFFVIASLLSLLSATLLIETIPQQLLHIGTSGLHLFRYLEYFALFFFLYSSITTKQQLKTVLTILAITILGVVVYGFGQEYFNFPVYSTMNREYSKGVTLYLQEGARPQSTFAGHYDLAAYLVIVLPIIFSLALHAFNPTELKSILQSKQSSLLHFITKQKSLYLSILLHIIHILGAWMLVTSGSKTALFAYITGIFVVLLQFLRKLGTTQQKIKWGSVGLITITIGLLVFLNTFGTQTRDSLISLIRNTVSNDASTQETKPEDLYGEGHEFRPVTVTNEDGTTTIQWVRQESVWSANALKYGLSMGIRLDTLWPNALKGLANSPLFGSGFATLSTIDDTSDYSYAESTDNNFLRSLGEIGILGFLVFYGFIGALAYEIIKNYKKRSPLVQAVSIGFLGSILGLLINATYIDVFAASKVAYTFWTFAGVTIAINKVNPTKTKKRIMKHLYRNPGIYFSIPIVFLLLHRNPFHKYSLVKNLSMTPEQLELIVSAKCFVQNGTFAVCRNAGPVLEPHKSLYSALLVPFMKFYNNPGMYYVLNILLFIVSLTSTYLILKYVVRKIMNVKPRKIILWTALIQAVLSFAILRYNDRPLGALQLLYLFVGVPFFLGLLVTFLHKLKYRMSFLIQICLILIGALILVNRDLGEILMTHYKNNQIPVKHETIEIANIHFDANKFLNREKDFYVITTLNPYYVDFYSNNHYHLLPLSLNQPYSNVIPQVYPGVTHQPENLTQLYTEIMNENEVFVTDFGVIENTEYQLAFKNLKYHFDLAYVAIGCEDTCNLYSVTPSTEKISPQPPVVLGKIFDPATIPNEYSFSIISNRFEPIQEVGALPYTTYSFTSFLQQNISRSDAFLFVTGDIYHSAEPASQQLFTRAITTPPLIFNAGNYDLIPNKLDKTKDTYFYTDSEFFLLLNIADDSTVDEQQKLAIYNAFLELEELPNIRSVFVIAHNLNWQDKSDPENFIFDLERKLLQFPKLEKYIITADHLPKETVLSPETLQQVTQERSLSHIVDETTNIQYLTSSVRNWSNDSFLEFSVHQDNSVTIQYRYNQ